MNFWGLLMGEKKSITVETGFFLLLPLSIHLHFSVFLLVDLILFHWLSLSFPWVSKVWFFQQKLCQIWKYISCKNCCFFFKDEEIPAYMTRISPSKKIQDTARVVRERWPLNWEVVCLVSVILGFKCKVSLFAFPSSRKPVSSLWTAPVLLTRRNIFPLG